MTARFSSLPVLQFCGGSARLNATGGAGRAAAMGTAFHALCSGAPEARSLRAALTDEEQSELDTWHRPKDITLGTVSLRYGDAQKEVACGLSAGGTHVPKGDDRAVVEGTADMFWFVDGCLYLADIKRSSWTVADGTDSLQIHGYALALADREGADRYRCGIWAAIEGTWTWGPEISLDSDVAARSWERISVAASRPETELATGPHCSHCYARSRCPAYLVAPEGAEELASPLMSAELTEETALELLTLADRIEETAKAAKERVRSFALERGGLRDGRGKVYLPVRMPGRSSLDRAALNAVHPEIVSAFTKVGPGYEQWKWTKEKAK